MKSSKLSTIRDARLKIAKPYTRRDLATNLYNFISYSKTEGTPLNWILKTFTGCKTDDLLQAMGELSMNGDIVPLTKGVYTIAKYAPKFLGQVEEEDDEPRFDDEYNVAYTKLVHLYEDTNNQDALDLMESAENAMGAKSYMYDWKDWLVRANKFLATKEPQPLPSPQEYKEPWQIPRTRWIGMQYEKSPQKGEVIKRLFAKSYDDTFRLALFNDKPIPEEVLEDSRHLLEEDILRLATKHHLSFSDMEKAVKAGIEGWKQIKSLARLSQKPKPTKVQIEKPLPAAKATPLPSDAQNVQELSFNSDQFTCYGKPTGRGFRAYCRRK